MCKLLEVEAEIKRSFRKDQLKHIIVDHLVDNDMLSGEALEKYPPLELNLLSYLSLSVLRLRKKSDWLKKN